MKLPIHELIDFIHSGNESSPKTPDKKLIRQANIKKVDIQQADCGSGLKWVSAVFFSEPVVVALRSDGIVVEGVIEQNKLVIKELKQEHLDRLEFLS